MVDCPSPFALTLLLLLSGIVNTIMFWSRAQGDIPAGWQVADGTNGTPDLRNDFPRCSGPGSAPGSAGGSTKHEHVMTGTLFSTILDEGADIDAGANISDHLPDDNVAVVSFDAYNHPPWMALFPIIFVGSN